MDIYLIGGFKGSGKTSLISKLTSYLTKKQFNIGVIYTELGEVKYNDNEMNDNISYKSAVSDCVSCTYRYDTVNAISDMYGKKSFDFLFIEVAGIGNPETVKNDIYEHINTENINLISLIYLIDSTNFIPEYDKVPSFMLSQIISSDTIIINKSDEVSETETNEIDKFIKTLNSSCHIFTHSDKFQNLDLGWFFSKGT